MSKTYAEFCGNQHKILIILVGEFQIHLINIWQSNLLTQSISNILIQVSSLMN